MSDILRKKIGYNGLIISDDLDMGGVLSAAPIEDAAVGTLRAGADMFLVCQKEENVWRAFEAVYGLAVSDGKICETGCRKIDTRSGSFKKKSRELKARMVSSPREDD